MKSPVKTKPAAASRPAPTYKPRQLIGGLVSARAYAILSVLILLGSVFFWTFLSAKVQNGNADQIIDPYLFSHPAGWQNAILPASHTMLLKWPLFWLVSAFGVSSGSLIGFTLLCVLLTVGIFAAILYKIERRPLVFGSLCLALASVLMLVPTFPAPGNLLPVNMAMLATRNLEYIIYIAAAYLFISSPRLHSRRFWLAAALLAVLGASDKLFLIISLAGGLVALVFYALLSGWNWVGLMVRWLVGAAVASVGALGILWWLNQNLVHISSQATAAPYKLVSSLHDLILGVIYALIGLLTNFGANPAAGTTVLRQMPHSAASHLFGVSGLSYLVNLIILAVGLWAVWRVTLTSIRQSKKASSFRFRQRLAMVMFWAAAASGISFVISQHYYAGDPRYLSIALFSIFIGLAVWTAQQPRLARSALLTAGGLMTVAIALAIPTVVKNYHQDQATLAAANGRNSLVAQALSHHPTGALVGDYWRVVPTKLASHSQINILPLQSCSTPRNTLTSQKWQINLSKNSFSYLLSEQGSLTDYPNCKLSQVITAYGKPNASVLINGSYAQPKEQLLFYDHGKNLSNPKTASSATPASSTVLPITVDQLPHTYCSVPTIMQVVAHQDDDLLFMNPDLLHDIQDKRCIRTIYITAGDSGAGQFYWLGRELGSEAAYDKMIGSQSIWVNRTVQLSNNQYVSIANPRGNNNVSLIFMHLPDGNLQGQGFANAKFESLAKLDAGSINQIQAIDGQSSYSKAQLIASLTDLMHAYQPALIRTQANFVGDKFADHSDHMAVGRLVKQAYAQYETQQYDNQLVIPIKFYIGYPIHQFGLNVGGSDLAAKEAAFLAYAQHDGGVCQSLQLCVNDRAYGAYLPRQYQNPY